MVARSYPQKVLHDRIDWSAERIIEKSSSMPVDDPAYQVGGVLPWERANTRSRASRLRVERKLTSAPCRSVSRFSAGFAYSKTQQHTRQSCKCDPYTWSIFYNSVSNRAYVFPRFPSIGERNLFETIVLSWKYKQKDEISWRKEEEEQRGRKRERGKVGRRNEVGIQRCTVCSLAFNFSTSQWTAPRLVRPGREERTDFSSRPQILMQVRGISEFAAVDALESSLGGVEWHVHDTVRTRGTVDSSNRASNRASNHTACGHPCFLTNLYQPNHDSF